MSVNDLDKGRHSVYSLYYHLVLVVKYRRKALYNEAVREQLKDVISDLGELWHNDPEMKIEIISQEPSEDHHHILFRATPQTNLVKVINSIKGVTARSIRRDFPDVKTILDDDSLWSPSYLLATSGQISLSVLNTYVESQDTKPEKD